MVRRQGHDWGARAPRPPNRLAHHNFEAEATPEVGVAILCGGVGWDVRVRQGEPGRDAAQDG